MTSPDSPPAHPESWRARLGRLAIRGTLFALAGRGAGEALRFASNLITTRLLMPEAFGLMLVVNATIQGARMMSDLGIRGSIVSHPRGGERAFLDTAWTTQALRGGGIFIALLIGADWIAGLEGHPEAAPLIRVSALCALIEGFASTAGFFLTRQVRPGRAIATELLGRCAGIVATIGWALASPSVWALVFGAIVASVAQVALSHRMISGYRDRFAWEPEAVRAIRRLGRWVLIASAMTYVLQRADALVLATMMSKAALGVYAIAIGLPQAVTELITMIAGNVLFPVFARIRNLELAEQRKEIARYRLAVLGAALPIVWLLAIAGPELIRGLYDDRYHEAGWMLQLLAISSIPTIVSLSAERVLMARGDSFSHLVLQASQAALLLAGLWAGSRLWEGPRGVILGMIAGRCAGYVPLALLVRARGLWLPAVDAAAFATSAVVLWAAFAWRGAP